MDRTTKLIKWKLKEVMARYDIKGVDLAVELDISTNAVSGLRRAKTMPRLDGVQLDLLLNALNKLAKDKPVDEVITHNTLIEYVHDVLVPSSKTSAPFAHTKRKTTKWQGGKPKNQIESSYAVFVYNKPA
ncbi:MAG: hypothetical protein N4J56_007384 [Chroococcidiopsis sp. SAG 2025]|uniref:helix-turn-helix domain-containing protein n=1 Tax=Chroococcidiopsis sp. SAG 2025 TaxID=171389 RepID=UPI0029372C7E|nr:helix-turn-helix domain-containing protein [Chroococcidiopsis sp. SAG 2025]MDV2997679.1 hypothetical protein [Chroococcidiopsis sp. SAG 2025]